MWQNTGSQVVVDLLRIAICDDSQDSRLSLRGALEQALDRQSRQGSIYEFSSGEGLLRWLEKHTGELDLVFLDMEMGELDGMETAKQLRQSYGDLQLVFVTAYADRVFEGYSVSALAYIMKPPKPRQLDEVLGRCLELLHRDSGSFFVCRSGEVSYRVQLKDILYFHSDRRQLTCVARNRSYTFYGKLDDIQGQLGEGFVRIHQRYLVNSAAVDKMSGSEVSIGEVTLPVSRSCQHSAMLALTRASLEDRPWRKD